MLTSEQQAKLKELRASREGQMKQRPRRRADQARAWTLGDLLLQRPRTPSPLFLPALPFIVPSMRARRSLPSFQ